MRFLLFTTLFAFLLFAQEKVNPKVFTALGDDIYTSVSYIEKLKNIKQYEGYREKIDNYVSEVKNTKIFGYQVASGSRSNVKLDYLQQLREHKKVKDYFQRSVQSTFKSALDTKDNLLFISMVNSGLLDTKVNRKEIMNYYKAHKKDINPKGIIQTFLDQEEAWKKRYLWNKKAKQRSHEEKVERLRKNDKLDQQALEKKLSDELKAKKEKIRQEQERELFN